MTDQFDEKAREIVDAQVSWMKASETARGPDEARPHLADLIATALRSADSAAYTRGLRDAAEVAKLRRVAVLDTMKGGRGASHPAEEMALKVLTDVIDAITAKAEETDNV